ncbi:hypothetical protein NYR97_07655 [Xanthomonas hydrangeae]|uniref:MarR family transcriptional regulator n=1 Tax=Xanthomonas hydrangeae TaxID=2775159 RepID=A0AAU0BDT4_9XANT|nr:hypothetical protein [Xanthomonas hydrangeae]WOB51238.1 hypothetical protein NYR97_07655 [Xanthomonas hydrangeae]
MSNIQEFDHACALIFDRLYESFPMRIDIEASELGFFDRNDLSNKPREILSATFCFLADEGYIDFARASDDKAIKTDIRLTSKGLSRLQRVPAGVQDASKPLIEQLKDAFDSIGSSTSSAAVAGATKKILSLIFGGGA